MLSSVSDEPLSFEDKLKIYTSFFSLSDGEVANYVSNVLSKMGDKDKKQFKKHILAKSLGDEYGDLPTSISNNLTKEDIFELLPLERVPQYQYPPDIESKYHFYKIPKGP